MQTDVRLGWPSFYHRYGFGTHNKTHKESEAFETYIQSARLMARSFHQMETQLEFVILSGKRGNNFLFV